MTLLTISTTIQAKDISTERYILENNKNIVDSFLMDKNISCNTYFINLQLKDTKDEINKFSKDKAGIYLILNNITLDYYIGSASTGKFYSRFYSHLIGLKGNKLVKNAVKKYKLDNFSFIILELFPEVINKENNKLLLDIEDFYLKSLIPNYNIVTEAGNTFGYKHTEIDRIKMKSNYSEERRNRIRNLNIGKTISEYTRNRMRERSLIRSKHVYTEQGIINMKKKSKAIILYNKNDTVYGEYNSITDASKILSCSVKTIIRALKSKSKLLKRT